LHAVELLNEKILLPTAPPMRGDYRSLTSRQTFDDSNLANIAKTGALLEALETVAQDIGTDAWTIFQYADDTYIYQNNSDVVFDAGDGLIKMSDVSMSDLIEG